MFELRGIAGRVFLSTAAIVCAVLLSALAVASHSGRRSASEAERHVLEQAADLAAQWLAGRGRALAGGARVFVQGPQFRAFVAEQKLDDITDQAIEAADQLGADWVFITDERGLLLAKSDEPGARGVSMAEFPLISGALEGRTMSGYGVSRDSVLFQALALPIVVPGAAPVGVLVATKIVDEQIARDIRAVTGTEIVFYTVDSRGAAHFAATSFSNANAARAALPALGAPAGGPRPPAPSRETVRLAEIGGVPYALQGGALTTAGGDLVGGFVVGRPEDSTPAAIAGVRRSLLLAGALGLVLALVAAWSAARRVTRPARDLATAAARALDGDYDSAARVASSAADGGRSAPREIAVLGGALAALLEELREKRAVVAILGRVVSATTGEHEPSIVATDRPLAARGRTSGSRGRALTSALTQPIAAEFTSLPNAAAPVAVGTVIGGRYALDALLGAGGTGVVYRATDLTLREPIALKMLRVELVATDPRAQEELKQELRLTRRVSHRNVVRTYDFGSSKGIPFITMEYVQGASLATILDQRGPLPPDVVIALAKQLVRALQAAHEQGVTHGDLKPANVLVAVDGLLKVTDFGVATLVRRPPDAGGRAGGGDEVVPPRLAGAVIGTPEYMAPEVLLGAAPDALADIYSAGVVLHECLTGATPFQRDTPRAFLSQKLEPPPPALTARAGLGAHGGGVGQSSPTTLEAVVAWMAATDPADRPQSAAALAAVLARLD